AGGLSQPRPCPARSRYGELRSRHERPLQAGRAPVPVRVRPARSMTRAFWAPGRVNLIGEHTDYSGGLSLPAALELGIRIEGDATAGPSNLSSDAGDAQRYVDAVTAELDALGRPSVGFTGRMESTLPIGTGLSSSAALEVAI